MSMLEIHRIYCQRFLDQFEDAQQNLLKMNQSESANEFALLFDCFKRECQKNLTRLKTDETNKDQYRLFKQLNFICNHIDKLSLPLESLKKDDYLSEQVINYFEEQHHFKKVIKNHIQDLNNFLISSTN